MRAVSWNTIAARAAPHRSDGGSGGYLCSTSDVCADGGKVGVKRIELHAVHLVRDDYVSPVAGISRNGRYACHNAIHGRVHRIRRFTLASSLKHRLEVKAFMEAIPVVSDGSESAAQYFAAGSGLNKVFDGFPLRKRGVGRGPN